MDIRTLIGAAWKATIADYEAGLINSEGTLQANLYAALRSIDPSLMVLCVPVLKDDVLCKVIPDMLVVRNQEIVCAIELKFVPHWRPYYKKDLDKLSKYAEYKLSFDLKLDPDTGKYDGNEYIFANDCVFVFGVIGRHDSESIDQDILRQYLNIPQFMPLTHSVKNTKNSSYRTNSH